MGALPHYFKVEWKSRLLIALCLQPEVGLKFRFLLGNTVIFRFVVGKITGKVPELCIP